MIELIFAFTMSGLGVHSLGADGCQPVEKVTAGTYLWLEDELLPLPDSHFISSFGSKSVGEYGSVYEIHLHALILESGLRRITIRTDDGVHDFDGFSWIPLREISDQASVRKFNHLGRSVIYAEYSDTPEFSTAIYESREYQVVVAGEKACELLLGILGGIRPQEFMSAE